MSEKETRRRRRGLVVPLVGVGVAVWVVRRRLGGRLDLGDGWNHLPPASWPAADPTSSDLVSPHPTPSDPAPAEVRPDPVPVAASTSLAPAATAPRPSPVPRAVPSAPFPVTLPAATPEPAAAVATEQPTRAVATATALASVTAPALPDAPFGPGSARALADGGSPDAEYTVKGKTATRVFHAPGGAYFTRTRADVWFRTADDARAAGFTERGPRRHS